MKQRTLQYLLNILALLPVFIYDNKISIDGILHSRKFAWHTWCKSSQLCTPQIW